MSIEQENIDNSPEVDLDTFSADFFGQNKAEQEPASSGEVEETEEDVDAPNDEVEDTQEEDSEDDTLDTEDEDESEGEEDAPEEEAPKPKKNRFQERIDELNGKYREEERQRKSLQKQLEELTARLDKNEGPANPAPGGAASKNKEPSADDKNEDGSDKYPLGEFDPRLARDIAKFAVQEQLEAARLAEEEATREREQSRAQEELLTKWNEKLEPARERYPDFVEKGIQLEDTFSGIDPSYGEYLTSTLMEMEHGPDVLYYLANNVDEAKAIVNSGARKATIALGRLEAKFAEAEAEKQLARPKVSKAPPPPKHLNKGSAVAKPAIKGDEDDLDSFSAAFFKKK